MSETKEKENGQCSDEKSCATDECEWCNSTGDIKRNNKYYWGAMILIIAFIVIVYILAVHK